MEEACKSLKLVRFFIFSPLSFSSRRFFFVGRFCPTDFTDIHRYSSSWFFFIGFHGGIGRHSCLPDYSRIFAELWPLANGSRPIYAPVVFCHADFADDADFSSWGGFCPTDFTDITQIFYGISGESLCPISGGICNDRTGRICENPWVIATARNLRINSVASDEKKSHEKKSASSAKSAWLKKRPNKYLCISVKSVGQKTPMKKSV